jgi:oxygen-dependent protoporphyrinogen oxidase
MQTLTDALAEKLGERVRLNSTVRSVAKGESGFEVAIAGGDAEFFDAVIISTPAWSAAGLVGGLDDDLANLLSGICYPPITVVYTGFKKGDVEAAPEGFGFLVPKREKMGILGSLWTSSVFENRAPEGYHLFTTFIGGARSAELALRNEDELIRIAVGDLGAVLGLTGPPEFVSVKKWERAIPQYNIGYRKVINAAADFDSAHRGIFFCSNFYRGISVGDCIKNSIATTKSVTDFLNE